VINAIPDGFVLINGEDLWPHLLEIKYIGYSPITAITCNNILSIRIDFVILSPSELEAYLIKILNKWGYSLEPLGC
jgi:hypothetical protein